MTEIVLELRRIEDILAAIAVISILNTIIAAIKIVLIGTEIINQKEYIKVIKAYIYEEAVNNN